MSQPSSKPEARKPQRDYSVAALVVATFAAVGLTAHSGYLMDRHVSLAGPIGKPAKPPIVVPGGPAEGEQHLRPGLASANPTKPVTSGAGMHP